MADSDDEYLWETLEDVTGDDLAQLAQADLRLVADPSLLGDTPMSDDSPNNWCVHLNKCAQKHMLTKASHNIYQ